METVTVTDNAVFARVKLGDIRPNRFRMLDRYPLEKEVLEGLKQSITDTGFWNNLQAVRNERGEVELRFGHHRLAAGLELFGPDYEVAVEIVPFNGENNLQDALAYENSIHRNKIAHTHEMVSVRRDWWDNKVFEAYPTWEDAVADECNFFNNRTGNLTNPILTRYFGEEPAGQGNYSRCVTYGIGREVLSKMLPGETAESIKQALASLPLTPRAKRGLEIQQENERRKAEELREKARLIHEGIERGRKEAEEAARIRQVEQARLDAEQREAEKAERQERSEANKEAARQKRIAADARMKEMFERQKAEEAEEKRKAKEDARLKAKAEADARQAEIRAKQKESVIESREWFDARAAEVFGTPSHGAEFRRSVSQDAVRPYLNTENLLPFAQAIKAKYGDDLTAEKIRSEINENFREFKKTLKLKEREAIDQQARDNPALEVIRVLKEAITDGHRFSGKLSELSSVMKTHGITGIQGPNTGEFRDMLSKVLARIAFFNEG